MVHHAHKVEAVVNHRQQATERLSPPGMSGRLPSSMSVRKRERIK
jgi:hypothetical protein